MYKIRIGFFVLVAMALGLALTACKETADAKTSRQAAAPEVGVVEVRSQSIALNTELPGRTAPYQVAEVRPQVSGIIKKRLFTEGADVKAGEVLYQIDPATYEASYNSAKASLAQAQANLCAVQLREQRYRELVKINAVSQQDYDDARAAFQLAEASVDVAQANLETARINLDYTRIKAPISGRIGRSAFTTGALVTANQAEPLSTIQRLDPIYVDVTQSTAELLRLKRNLAKGLLSNNSPKQAEVNLLLEDGTPYAYPGTMKFSDVTVNQSTGSVTLRTLFPNPEQLLLPGMFVRAILEEGINEQAILAPQRGISRNPAGAATALVVGAEEKVESRVIKVDRTFGDTWLVSEGLQPGDRLIVEGLQKARPGTTVKAVSFEAADTASQTAAVKK